jgi:EmrB/QacA subfamily drug resistance transporter
MEPPAAMLPEPPAEDVVDDARRRRGILAAAVIGLVAVVASVSGLNVAQVDLAAELGASQGDLLWIINGYTIALAALLLPVGAVGDRWGRKKVLLSGLAVFLVANAVAPFAGGVTALLVARVVAGAAAAMIMPATLSVITSSFPVEERDRAVGVWAGFAGAGGILGLLGSAFVVDLASWEWVFAMPIALAVAALGLTVVFVPHSREHHDHRFDTVGSILSAVAVGAVVLGIHEGPEKGWTEPVTLVGLVLGGAALLAFVAWELRHPHPLLQLRLFRDRMLTSGSLSLLVVFALLMALFLVLIQFLQAVLGYSALRAAVGLMPLALLIMPMSTLAPVLARRFGMRAMFTTGALLIGVGLALMGVFATDSYWSVLPGLLVLSLGTGTLMTPGTTAITSSLPAEEQGVASALNDTVRELGGAVGVALIGSVLSAAYSANVAGAAAGLPEQAADAVQGGIGGAAAVSAQMGPAGASVMDAARTAFVDAWQTTMWLSAGLAVAAAVFALVWTPGRRRERAQREAAAPSGAGTPAEGQPVVAAPAGVDT